MMRMKIGVTRLLNILVRVDRAKHRFQNIHSKCDYKILHIIITFLPCFKNRHIILKLNKLFLKFSTSYLEQFYLGKMKK
jgi:hypothetical protein